MPFQFSPYQNRYAGTIGDLLLRRGDIDARAAEQLAATRAQAVQQQGQIWGGAVQNLGQIVAGIPGQIQQARAQQLQGQINQQQQQLGALRLQDAQRQMGGQQAVAGLLQGDQLPPGDA